MKLFYFHVPKTAGSSINDFFSNYINKYHFHIEGVQDLDEGFFDQYDFLSGHMSYTQMDKLLKLNDWITFATFREPISYAISHLKWVRKLADPGEEERFNAHPPIFQEIALKMTKFDFSSPEDIQKFIKWLESIDFYYLHNTQLRYMNLTSYRNALKDTSIEIALTNMRKINFIGIQEEMSDYMDNISYEFNWEVKKKPFVNTNDNNYGFDILCDETKKALFPLYEKDIIIYEEARRLYCKQKVLYENENTVQVRGFVDSRKKYSISGWARFEKSLKKVELDLKLDGKIVSTTTANIFRQGLKTKGIHPSGLCGFGFVIDQDINVNKCKVYVKNTDIELPSSGK